MFYIKLAYQGLIIFVNFTTMKRLLFILGISFTAAGLYSQDIDPDGFNRFYYPNGSVSGEGTMINGKPDGYWKNYYEDGTLKSVGKRLYYELDSIWNFYHSDGQLAEAITYRNDKKNGYSSTYDFYYTSDSVKIYYLTSRELYLNGQKEGMSYYYDTVGYLRFEYQYKNGVKSGRAREFNKDSLAINLFNYYNGYRIESEKINRFNSEKKKHGKWIEFYPNGNKKTEFNYFNGILHGIYREYDLSEKMIVERKYVNGEIFVPKPEDEIVLKAEVKKLYHENGKIQYEGAFLEDMPVGIHKEYDTNGKLTKVKEYTSQSILLGEGLFDTNGNRTGEWKLFDEYNDYFYAIGNYVEGKRDGIWKYYYKDGKLEMEGFFNQDKPDREWIWYYPNGIKKREEAYLKGKLEGLYVEYDSIENVILKGEYFDDVRTGEWFYAVGDIIEEGSYELGEKDGEWKHYYSETGQLRFIGKYRKGDADGTHKWYYPNGNIELIGEYRVGSKYRDWKKFHSDGSTYMIFTYRNDELIKIDGRKLKRGGWR